MTYLERFMGEAGLIKLICESGDLTLREIVPTSDTINIENAYRTLYGNIELSLNAASMTTQNLYKSIQWMFKSKWDKLVRDFTLEYNPLDAYRVTETHDKQINRESDKEINYGRTDTHDSTDTGTVGNISNGGSTTTANVYGYNSVEGVPANTSSDTRNDNSTETRNLANHGTDVSSGKDERTDVGHETEHYTTERSGNIGYTTPQELLRQDIELWYKSFFDIVFNDINSFIAVQVRTI